ncbi:hypothetical protein GZ22_13045 [Terribacillus saccharophilus]|uniref:Uncharacterized protein n=1 Tax=Terribacillus saccharophilus TaxID=361277 RepID=A0A075LL27_9BACI|nr:hypothetical protein GZ22_13045 [Terribacillus goriensis]
MKTYSILFLIIAIMHFMILINTTLLKGEWNGIVLWVSSFLFLVAVFFASTEFQAHKKRRKE